MENYILSGDITFAIRFIMIEIVDEYDIMKEGIPI